MFRGAKKEFREVIAEGRVFRGRWEPIDLSRYFRYHRGATNLGVHESARAFRKSGFKEEQRAFAHWLAAREKNRGRELRAVRFRIKLRNVDTQKVRYREVGAFDVTKR